MTISVIAENQDVTVIAENDAVSVVAENSPVITIIGEGNTNDEKVKITASDTTTGYLQDKLVAGSNITITKNNAGANETLTIASTASGGGVDSVFGRTGAVVAQSGDYTTAIVADSSNKRYVTDAQLVVIGNTSGTNTGDQTNITGNAGTVTTINGKITAGSNITLTGAGTTASPYTIDATGFANPMTTTGDIIQGTTAGAAVRLAAVATGNALISGGIASPNSWGKIGLTTHVSGILPIANGGWGQDMTMQTSTLVGNQTAFPAGLIKWNGGSNVVIQGIAAPSTSVRCTIQNITGSNMSIAHQNSSATAANRIITPNGGTVTVASGFSAELYYDTVTGRWRFLSLSAITSASSPLSLGAGNLAIATASSAATGALTATDWNTFNNKVGGNGQPGYLGVWSDTTVMSYDDTLFFDTTNNGLSVGVGASTEATGHFKSQTARTLALLTGISVTKTLFPLLATPTGLSVTQQAGHLYAPTGASATPQAGTNSLYLAGDVIDYRITAYNSDSGTVYSAVSTTTQTTIVNGTGAGDGDDVTINWTDNTAGTATISGYAIERQINGGGYNQYVYLSAVTSYLDTSSGWGASSPPLSPTFPDFIATGATRNYTVYSKGTTPISTDVYSASGFTPSGFTDDNSGNPFVISHFVTTSEVAARTLNTGSNTYADGLSYVEDTTTFVSGSTVTPTTYGYLSDGTNLNRDYDFYNYGGVLSALLYSLTSGIYSTSDTNDGSYYYNVISFDGISTSAKILRQVNGGGYTVSEVSLNSPIIDDGITAFADNVTVTPNAVYPNAGLFEGYGAATSDPATIISRSLTGNYSRIAFQNTAASELAYFEMVDAQTLIINAPGSFNYNVAGNNKFNMTATAAGFSVPLSTTSSVSIGGGHIDYIVAKNANYTLTTIDYCVNCVANTFAITLPTAVSVTGQTYIIKNSGTGVITLNTTSSQTIDGQASGAITLAQYVSYSVMSTGTGWIII